MPLFKRLEILLGGSKKFDNYSKKEIADAKDLAENLYMPTRDQLAMLGRWLFQDLGKPPDHVFEEFFEDIIDMLDEGEDANESDKKAKI